MNKQVQDLLEQATRGEEAAALKEHRKFYGTKPAP